MKKIIWMTCILCLFVANGFAKVPYKLKKGELIDAERLNANFEYLDTSDGEFEVQAAGELIGQVNRESWLFFKPDFIPMKLNRDGTVVHGDNDEDIVYFKQTGCQGETYAYYSTVDDKRLYLPPKGQIFDHGRNLYYLATDTINLYNITALSRSWGHECSATSRQGLFFKLRPNDQAVTGIQTYPFPTPLTITGMTEINVIIE